MGKHADMEPLLGDESLATINGYGRVNSSESGDISTLNEQPPKKWTGRRKACVSCAVIAVVVLPLFIGLVVPAIAESLMRTYLGEAEITVVEMEILSMSGGTAEIRLEGRMFVDAPFSVSGEAQETYVNLLVPDPEDRSTLGVVGTVLFPYMEVEGLEYERLRGCLGVDVSRFSAFTSTSRRPW